MTKLQVSGLDWPRLRSLVLEVTFPSSYSGTSMKSCIEILEEFRPETLKEVTVEFREEDAGEVFLSWIASDQGNLGMCLGLDRALARFPYPQLFPFGGYHVTSRRVGLWAQELIRYFPELTKRGSISIFSRPGVFPHGLR